MKRYIKATDLQGIKSGSFEEQRTQTLEAIDRFERTIAAVDKKLDGASNAKVLARPLSLVATFESHAIVADAEGTFHRYTLDRHFDVRRETIEGKLTEVEYPMKAVRREPYEGFRTMTEAEAKRDHTSLVEGAKSALTAGKDATSAMVELIREAGIE